MAPHHFCNQPFEQVGHGELPQLAGDLRVEHHLEEQVPQLLHDGVPLAAFQRLESLVGFLDQVGLERGAGLLAVPGAALLCPETGHHGEEGVKEGSGRVGHVRHLGMVSALYTRGNPGSKHHWPRALFRLRSVW